MTPISVCQRWTNGRDSYRPAGEVVDTSRYDVVPIPDDTTARRFIESHHYSGTYPAARWRFGLYRSAQLVGVAVFSHPTNDKTICNVFPGVRAVDGVELGRFVLLDQEPANAETWFLARCFEVLRGLGLAGVVSFSDPSRRTNRDGVAVFGGHVGTIYQAMNAVYAGRGTPRTNKLLPNGQVLSSRAMQKVRSADQGVRYTVEQLVAHGAERPGGFDDPEVLAEWLRHWTGKLCHSQRHKGNHRYCWTLNKRVTVNGAKVKVRYGLPVFDHTKYPKQVDD